MAQEPITNQLIEEVLKILGVEYTFSGLDHLPCLIDTRRRANSAEPSASHEGTIFFDDFLPVDESVLALQGRPAAKPDFYSEPVLSIRARRLFEAIRESFHAKGLPLVTKGFWPLGAPACLVLTHDVDWFSYSPFHRAAIRGESSSKYLKSVLRYCIGRRYGYNIPSTLRVEADFGVKSTFLYRNSYASNQQMLLPAIRLCQESGCEVALHATKKSRKLRDVMANEKSTMERICGGHISGLREHALKFEYDKTWDCIEYADFEYDMTMGDNERVGFIGGFCHPFHPLSPNGEVYSLIEIPTSFMDWSAIHAGIRNERLGTVIQQLITSVAELGGVLCVNFHNTYLDSWLFPDIEREYRALISECKSAGFWVATAEQCAEWWVKREEAVLGARFEGESLRLDRLDSSLAPVVHWPYGKVELLNETQKVLGG